MRALALPTELTPELQAEGYKDLILGPRGERILIPEDMHYVSICSVYPGELIDTVRYQHIELDAFGPKTVHETFYRIPEPPEHGSSTLRVYDGRHRYMDGNVMGEIVYHHPHIPAATIARELVENRRSSVVMPVAGCWIGVGKIAGDKPTKAEVDDLKGVQEQYFRHQVEEALKLWDDEEKRHQARSRHFRIAAKWLGQEDLPFMKEVKAQTLKTCFICESRIGVNVEYCRECKNNLVEYALNNNTPAERLAMDPIVGPIVAQRRRAAAERPVAPVPPPKVTAGSPLSAA